MKRGLFLLLVVCLTLSAFAQIRWKQKDTLIDKGSSNAIVASGDSIFVAYSNSNKNEECVYIKQSDNNGRTWSAPKRIYSGNTLATNLKIAVSGQNVYVLWTCTNIKSTNAEYKILLNKSNDYGLTWLNSERIIDEGTGNSNGGFLGVQLLAKGEKVYIVWGSYANFYVIKNDIFFDCSLDGGNTWLSKPTRLNTGDIPANSASVEPRLSVNNNNVYVVWHDYRGGFAGTSMSEGENLFFNSSTNNGLSWKSSDKKIDVSSYIGASDPYCNMVLSNIISNTNMVYLFFNGDRLHKGTYLKYSSDYGKTWNTDVVRIDHNHPAYGQITPIISDNNTLQLIWQSKFKIYHNYSKDKGQSWNNDSLVSRHFDNINYENLMLNSYKNKIYAMWTENSISGKKWKESIHFNYSRNYGLSWQEKEIIINNDKPMYLSSCIMAISGENVYSSWVANNGNNNTEIYFNKTNINPVAQVKQITSACIGQELTLDGSLSYDPDDDPISYKWRFIRKPLGSKAFIKSPFKAVTKFTPDIKGKYRLTLRVKDIQNYAVFDDLVCYIGDNAVPVIDGKSEICYGTVVFNGKLSYSNCGTITGYLWKMERKPIGSTVKISDTTNSKIAFNVDIAGEYKVSLKVKDNRGKWSRTITKTTIASVGSPPNMEIYTTKKSIYIWVFSAEYYDISIKIRLSNNCQIPIKKYILERKQTGEDFKSILEIAPENLNLDSEYLTFNFTDEYILRKKINFQYRIKAIDNNGEIIAIAATN